MDLQYTDSSLFDIHRSASKSRDDKSSKSKTDIKTSKSQSNVKSSKSKTDLKTSPSIKNAKVSSSKKDVDGSSSKYDLRGSPSKKDNKASSSKMDLKTSPSRKGLFFPRFEDSDPMIQYTSSSFDFFPYRKKKQGVEDKDLKRSASRNNLKSSPSKKALKTSSGTAADLKSSPSGKALVSPSGFSLIKTVKNVTSFHPLVKSFTTFTPTIQYSKSSMTDLSRRGLKTSPSTKGIAISSSSRPDVDAEAHATKSDEEGAGSAHHAHHGHKSKKKADSQLVLPHDQGALDGGGGIGHSGSGVGMRHSGSGGGIGHSGSDVGMRHSSSGGVLRESQSDGAILETDQYALLPVRRLSLEDDRGGHRGSVLKESGLDIATGSEASEAMSERGDTFIIRQQLAAAERRILRAEMNSMYRMGVIDIREVEGDHDESAMLINVGGNKQRISVDVLLSKPDTRLGKLAVMHRNNIRQNVEYFFDNHGLAFRAIIDYYRSGKSRIVSCGTYPRVSYIVHMFDDIRYIS